MIKALGILLAIVCSSGICTFGQNPAGIEWKKDREESPALPKERNAEKHYIPQWQFGLNGGIARRLFRPGNIPTAAEERYIDALKSGISFGGNVSYFVWRNVGFGIVFDRYQNKATSEDGLSENVVIQHLSGAISHRKLFKNLRTSVLSSFMTGYQPYSNQTMLGSEQLTFSGRTMGWGLSVGIEHRLTEHFALSLTGNAMMGAIYRMKRQTDLNTTILHLSKDDSVDLSRAWLTLGLRFM